MCLSLSRASPFIVITSREWCGPRETLNKRYFPEILMNGWRVVDERTTDVPSYNTYFKHVNSKLWRQHTKAPLAAAFSTFMSLLYPPNLWSMWMMWCEKVDHNTGVYVPYSFRTVVWILLRPTTFSSPEPLGLICKRPVALDATENTNFFIGWRQLNAQSKLKI